jgi:GYF domain 2
MAEMWYYTTEGKQMDAVTIKELKRLVGDGTLKPTDMVWKDGMPRWIRASSVRELFPDPMSGLDQYFTSTTEAERKEAQAKTSSVTAGSKSATAAPMPVSGSNGTMPPAPADAATKKRSPAAGERERPARRPRDAGGGGSSIMIIMALVVGGILLFGALGVGFVILVFVIPKDDPNRLVDVDKDKKDAGPDGNVPPIKDGKDPGPKNDPLPQGVREGRGRVDSPQAIGRNGVFAVKFRVKAGHAASFKAIIPTPGPGTKFIMNVLRDSDHSVVFISDKIPSVAPSVNFQIPNTEIVLLRVQNVGPTANKLSVVYDVSP